MSANSELAAVETRINWLSNGVATESISDYPRPPDVQYADSSSFRTRCLQYAVVPYQVDCA